MNIVLTILNDSDILDFKVNSFRPGSIVADCRLTLKVGIFSNVEDLRMALEEATEFQSELLQEYNVTNLSIWCKYL